MSLEYQLLSEYKNIQNLGIESVRCPEFQKNTQQKAKVVTSFALAAH